MRVAPIVACCALLGGCYITGLNQPAQHGSAHITIPRIDDHTMAVYVYAANSKHRFVEQRIPKEQRDGLFAFSLSAGTHVLEIDCYRPLNVVGNLAYQTVRCSLVTVDQADVAGAD